VPTVLITGANRGLGLEFARQYAAEGWRVIATCRDPCRAEALRGLNADVHSLDVRDFGRVAELGRQLEAETIDVLIANAGVLLDDPEAPRSIHGEPWRESFEVNTMAPLACAGAFVQQVARSAQRKMIAIGSIVGSISAAARGGYYPYRASKAALNAVWRSFSLDHPEIIAAVLHPGRMRTDMVSYDKAAWASLVPPEQRATELRAQIARLEQADSGGFFNYAGKPLPW
jgi:NAD(P)-dependent dehydrogenase (short-subunit alcohol dehydrogenase family)